MLFQYIYIYIYICYIYLLNNLCLFDLLIRGGSRAAATSKMERFVITVSGCESLTVITKCSMLVVASSLDPPLLITLFNGFMFIQNFALVSKQSFNSITVESNSL